VGWKFLFGTEVCVLEKAVVLRYTFDGQRAYMVCTSEALSQELIEALLEDSKGDFSDGTECGAAMTLIGLEDSQVPQLSGFLISVESIRDRYDYIYCRTDLATLHGKHLDGKRNHIRRFRTQHPDFEYRPLMPEFFDECRRLTEIWQEEKGGNDTIHAEKQVMETIFSNWDALGMIGGSIFVDGRMVAFAYGSAVTTDTFDVCVEKADRHVEGAFAIINQQFAEHLSEQYVYLNREEDMGIPGLRQAKLSYHPEILLTYNAVHITEND
jgi:hypothetical protein